MKNSPNTMIFSDKCVTFDIFVSALASEILKRLHDASLAKYDELPLYKACKVVSQNQAFLYYGKGNVNRWIKRGDLQPCSVRKGKILYKATDLDKLNRRVQDYF